MLFSLFAEYDEIHLNPRLAKEEQAGLPSPRV
jgi:hypothetical protein